MITPDTWSWRRIAAGAAAHSSLLGFAFAPFNVWPLVFLAPVPLVMVALRASNWKTLAAWVFGMEFLRWLYVQSWVGEISVAGWPPMAAYLALYSVAMALLIRRFATSRRFGSVPFAITMPVVLLGVEFLRGSIMLGGYPWYLLGQPMIGWLPLAQAADLGGAMFISLLPAAIGGSIVDFILHRRVRVALGTGVLAAVWIGYGALRIRPLDYGEPGPVVLLLQTNIPVSIKTRWTPEAQLEDTVRFARTTLDGLDRLRAEGIEPSLAVWPETMLPGPGLEIEATNEFRTGGWFPGDSFRELTQTLRDRGGVPLLIGSGSFEGLSAPADGEMSWDKRFNSVYLVDEALPDARYDKVHLTPFGERMPLISDLPWLEQKLLDFGANGMTFDLDEATDITRFLFAYEVEGEEETISLGTPICFEDTLPWVCRDLVWEDGVKVGLVLVNVSNDGWFGSSDAARQAHLNNARFRAIENRVPLLRSVNTGLTAWVDPSGRIRASLPPNTEGTLTAFPRLDRGWTVFGAIGNVPSGMMFVVVVLGALVGKRNEREQTEIPHDDT